MAFAFINIVLFALFCYLVYRSNKGIRTDIDSLNARQIRFGNELGELTGAVKNLEVNQAIAVEDRSNLEGTLLGGVEGVREVITRLEADLIDITADVASMREDQLAKEAMVQQLMAMPETVVEESSSNGTLEEEILVTVKPVKSTKRKKSPKRK